MHKRYAGNLKSIVLRYAKYIENILKKNAGEVTELNKNLYYDEFSITRDYVLLHESKDNLYLQRRS
jgi:hypothetical protein